MKVSWNLDPLGAFRAATLSKIFLEGRFGYPGDVIFPEVSFISILLQEALKPDRVMSSSLVKMMVRRLEVLLKGLMLTDSQ